MCGIYIHYSNNRASTRSASQAEGLRGDAPGEGAGHLLRAPRPGPGLRHLIMIISILLSSLKHIQHSHLDFLLHFSRSLFPFFFFYLLLGEPPMWAQVFQCP